MIVTFCGHKQIYQSSPIATKLKTVIEELIGEGATEFYVGGYGNFDSLVASSVREAKSAHPDIRLVLIIPYLNRQYETDGYDEVLYPPLESVPLRFSISKRNEWMVDQADVVISYVTHEWGGAYTALTYASRKKKRIISVVPLKS